MSDEFDDNKVEGTESETEELDIEEKPPLPQEPADRNESIDVPVTRQEKKRNRFKEFEERTARAEKAAEEARREAQEARQLHQQRLSHPQDQSRQQQNPVAQRLQDIQEAKRRLHREYEIVASRPGFTQAEHDEYERKADALLTAQMAAVSQASAPQMNEQEIYRKVAWQQFTTEHADVTTNPKAWNWAIGLWQQKVQGEGEADTKDLAERILDQARVKFGMKPRRGGGGNPDAATRARLSGVSAQGGAGDGESSGAVRMGPRERKMAEELYDKDPPKVAWQKWANGPGKRAALKSAARK
jgi:hypothetical protein